MSDALPSYAELLQRDDAPAGSAWGLFGADDDRGAVNLVSPDCVVEAARCVRRGVAFNLDYPLDAFPGPLRHRHRLQHHMHFLGARDDGSWGATDEPAGMVDDYLDGFYPQASSQLDGLRHVAHGVHGFYNRFPAARAIAAGDPGLGVNRWAERPLVARGVLVDVAGYREDLGRPLDHPAGEPIGVRLLEETLQHQKTTLLPGDALVLRTGYREFWTANRDDDAATSRMAGLEQTREVVAWLWDRRIPLVGCDNLAVEAVPPSPSCDLGDGPDGSLHVHLIALLGMVLGELWKLDELAADCAADGRYDFMLVSKPLNLVGGAGSPANATAVK